MSLGNLDKLIDEIDRSSSLGELHRSTVAVKEELGFSYYAFIQSNSGPSIGGLLLQDYPDTWMKLQAETFGFSKSPILQVAARTATPFEWSSIADLTSLTDDQLAYLQSAAEHGLAQGFTIPIHAPGAASAMVSFVNPVERPINRSKLPQAMFVAARVFAAGTRVVRASTDHRPGLSERDARVITLICRGQSKRCISNRLGIELAEVGRAVTRGCKYYRVGSQTEMIVHALYERSIRFEDIVN